MFRAILQKTRLNEDFDFEAKSQSFHSLCYINTATLLYSEARVSMIITNHSCVPCMGDSVCLILGKNCSCRHL